METLTTTAVDLVATYGIAVLLVAFVLEGALIGKVIPTRTMFVAVVLAVGSDVVAFLPVVFVAVVGATVGQCVLLVSIRHLDVDPTRIDTVPVSEERLDGADHWLSRWGLPAVAVTNLIPGIRGWLTLPTATAPISTSRFAVASFAGSATYIGALVLLAFGFERGLTHMSGIVSEALVVLA